MSHNMDLPVFSLPLEGQLIDRFKLLEIISEGRYARLFNQQKEDFYASHQSEWELEIPRQEQSCPT